jgi:two-component system sensor histidine kinase VicK
VSEFAALFEEQAEASAHVHFVYDVAVGRVAFVNPAYEAVLHGSCGRVNEELPTLLDRLHPDDRAYLTHCWKLWVRGRLTDEL